MNIEFLKEKLLDDVDLNEEKLQAQKEWLMKKIIDLYTEINPKDEFNSFKFGEYGLFCFLLFNIAIDLMINDDDFKNFIKK